VSGSPSLSGLGAARFGGFRVAARGASRAYGRQRALGATTVELGPGESVALLGPNGAGKSTLCGLLATLVHPSTGEVVFTAGDAPLDATAVRAAIGLCAHESLCYADLSGRENLTLFARLYRVENVRARVDELLARVGLAEAQHRPARTYSRGMLQRLALARALVHRPRFLILDEPFTGLDRGGADTLAAILREERTLGTILLVVTHDLDAVAELVARVLILRRGQLVFDGPAPATGDGLRALYREHADAPARAAQGAS
jgi:heme exporter protein A